MVGPAAPWSLCNAAISGVLWVLQCGQSSTPARRTRSAISSMFPTNVGPSTRTAGVWTSSGVGNPAMPTIISHPREDPQAFVRLEDNGPPAGMAKHAPEAFRMATRTDTLARRSVARIAVVALAASLPLIGLVSLLLRSELDPHFENYRAHFVVFGIVGGLALILGYAAGEAANRRADARVLLLSLAFMATGGFLGLHALGTPQVLFTKEHPGFMVAIPVGLFVAALFAAASAFVDERPQFG